MFLDYPCIDGVTIKFSLCIYSTYQTFLELLLMSPAKHAPSTHVHVCINMFELIELICLTHKYEQYICIVSWDRLFWLHACIDVRLMHRRPILSQCECTEEPGN